MKVHSFAHKLILYPVYYIFHHNFLFGYIHKIFFNVFKFKKFKFYLKLTNLPISHRASFLFKTYEYNDRIVVEKNLSNKNKCIVIGGGIGFIPTLAFHKTKNSILVFEINKKIIKNLKNNLQINHCNYKLLNKNLVFDKKKISNFYYNKNFLETSSYLTTKRKFSVNNIYYKKIKNFSSFNTLIIDGEGAEEYYINNLTKLKNIKHILFELHNNIHNHKKIKEIFHILKKNKFKFNDKCFNSYYFKKSI